MSDQSELEPDREGADDNALIRGLRAKARKTDALEAENQRLRTELAFRDAGVELSDPQRSAVLGQVEGEVSAEAVRQAVEQLAFVAPPQVPTDEQTALGRFAQATVGAEAVDAKVETLEDRIRNAKTEAELDAIMANAGMIQYD